MIRKIVAIGGGEIGRTKILEDGTLKVYPMETISIDEEIIRLSGKKHPKLLLIPTASRDSTTYLDAVVNYFGKKFGCFASVLNLLTHDFSPKDLEDFVLSADIIYVGGGDTRFMLEQWKKVGLDVVFKKAYNAGIVISGLSAGAVCWFEYYDNTDYKEEAGWCLDVLPGLGWIKGFAVPHFDDLSETEKSDLKNMLKEKSIRPVWAIDNCAAVVFENEVSRVLNSQSGKEVKRY